MQPMSTWHLERVNLLQKLTETEQGLFLTQGTRVHLQKGEVLFPADAEGGCVFILLQGFSRLVALGVEGKRFSIGILKQGDFFGAMMAPSGQAISNAEEFIEAMSSCELLRISGTRFHQVLTDNPQLFLSVLQHLQGKTQLLQRKLSDLLFKDVHSRIAQLFLDLMFQYGQECPHAFGLTKDLSLKHHEIAELIGASRPVTSMALGDFLKADLIHKHDGLICLQDLELLKQVADGGAKRVQSLCQARQLSVVS